MNRMLLVTALLCGTLFSGKAQNNVLTMDNQRTKTIRLVYPQWQGGDIAHWITEVKDPEQASRGYYLGAQLLNFLAPDSRWLFGQRGAHRADPSSFGYFEDNSS